MKRTARHVVRKSAVKSQYDLRKRLKKVTAIKKHGGPKVMRFGSDHWRQLDIANPEKLVAPITVVGAGGIGSEVVKVLAKVGFPNIEVYDHDYVEPHNLPNQFYRMNDIGKQKVTALREIVLDFSGVEIKPKAEFFNAQKPQEILIVVVDSMDTRIAIYNKVKALPHLRYLIDGRMGAEIFCIYTVDMRNPMEREHYEKSLYPSSEAVELPCTARAIMYNCGVVASMIVNNVKRICMKQDIKKQIDCDLTHMALYTL